MGPAAWDFITAMFHMDCSIVDVLHSYWASLSNLADPSLLQGYSLDKLTEHVKCAFIVFMQWVWAVLYSAQVVSADAGLMDPDKLKFTFQTLFPVCTIR